MTNQEYNDKLHEAMALKDQEATELYDLCAGQPILQKLLIKIMWGELSQSKETLSLRKEVQDMRQDIADLKRRL